MIHASYALPSLIAFSIPGGWEWVLIVLAVLLLFGGRKLPELARGLGRGLREFRDELKGTKKDITEGDSDNESGENPYAQNDKDQNKSS